MKLCMHRLLLWITHSQTKFPHSASPWPTRPTSFCSHGPGGFPIPPFLSLYHFFRSRSPSPRQLASSHALTVCCGEGLDGSPGCGSVHEGDRFIARGPAAGVCANLPGGPLGQTTIGQQSAQSQVVVPTRPLAGADTELEKDNLVWVEAHAQVPYTHLTFLYTTVPTAMPTPAALSFFFFSSSLFSSFSCVHLWSVCQKCPVSGGNVPISLAVGRPRQAQMALWERRKRMEMKEKRSLSPVQDYTIHCWFIHCGNHSQTSNSPTNHAMGSHCPPQTLPQHLEKPLTAAPPSQQILPQASDSARKRDLPPATRGSRDMTTQTSTCCKQSKGRWKWKDSFSK